MPVNKKVEQEEAEKLKKKIRETLMGRIHDGAALDRYTENIMFDVNAFINKRVAKRTEALLATQLNEARLDEAEKALMVTRVHRMDKPNDIYKVLSDRVKQLQAQHSKGEK